MINATHLAFFNLVLFVLLSFCITVFIYIYPKKRIKPTVILFLYSLLPVLSIFRPGTYESGDLSLHIKFAMDFYNSLSNGILLPRWAAYTCGGFGCPHFIFIY